jgi:hypothetical protein
MSYTVHAFNFYSGSREDPDRTIVKFHSDKVLICDVLDEVAQRVTEMRMHNGQDYTKTPDRSVVRLFPKLTGPIPHKKL